MTLLRIKNVNKILSLLLVHQQLFIVITLPGSLKLTVCYRLIIRVSKRQEIKKRIRMSYLKRGWVEEINR